MKKSVTIRKSRDIVESIDRIAEDRLVKFSYIAERVMEKLIIDSDNDAKVARQIISKIKHFNMLEKSNSEKSCITIDEDILDKFRSLIAPMPFDVVLNNLLYHLKNLSPEELDDYNL